MSQNLKLQVGSESGFSLIEMIFVTGIMGVATLAMMTLQSNQVKANNFLQFQLRRTEIKNEIMGQFLNNPDNCACLFEGSAPFAADPSSPGATLTGTNPTQIGKYKFVTTGVCSTATVPQPFVNNTGIEGVKATSVQLRNILNISGAYSGELYINLQSTKQVLGPQELPLKIPVSIATTSAGGGNVSFAACTTNASSSAGSGAILAYSFDATEDSRNGLGGTTGNCNLNNRGILGEFANENVTFSLPSAQRVVVSYNSSVLKKRYDATGTGQDLYYIDGTQVYDSGTGLVCEPMGFCAGIGVMLNVEFPTEVLSAGTHTLNIKHRVDCGTVYWSNRFLRVRSF